MYILFPWPGYKVLPLCPTGSNGEPEAKITLPSVHSTASLNSTSDSLTGLDSGKIIGLGFSSAMRLTTTSSNASCEGGYQNDSSGYHNPCAHLDCGETQQRSGFYMVDHVNELFDRWTSIVFAGEIWVKNRTQNRCQLRTAEVYRHFLCSGSFPRSSYTRPCESTNQMRSRASSSERPSSLKKLINCLATPTPADPAPKKRILCSLGGRPEAAEESLAALMNPERTTAPVP